LVDKENQEEKTNDPVVTGSQLQSEEVIVENPNDSLSSVTQKLEDIHVTVGNENTTTSVLQETGLLLHLHFIE
jgi:hypothetical protein